MLTLFTWYIYGQGQDKNMDKFKQLDFLHVAG